MKLEAVTDLNRALRENRLEEVTRALGREPGMRALGFEPGLSRWEWTPSDERARNPFGYVFGGYLGVFVDILLSSAIGTVGTVDLDVCGLVRRYKALAGGVGQPSIAWLDVTTLYPASSLPPPLPPP